MATTYEYDEQGRVSRTWTASPWTDEDRALMLALRQYDAAHCPGCGELKERAWHPDNEDQYRGPDDPVVCWSCTAMRQYNAPDDKPVEPVTYGGVQHDRDYDANPLPPPGERGPRSPGRRPTRPTAPRARPEPEERGVA